MTRNNVKIAVTGGIGSGKSAVAEIIRNLGYEVYSCDEIYAELLSSREFIKIISSVFDGIVLENDKLDRRKLSDIVFSDEIQLKKLNEISHPAIMEEAFKRLNVLQIGFCEVPLLFENDYEELFDEVIVVLRSKSERIGSVIKRSGLSKKEVKKRIKSQFDYDNYNFTKYYVIHNDGNLTDLSKKTVKTVEEIVEKYFKKF